MRREDINTFNRKVALKVLCPRLSSDKTFIDRFMKEARNSAKLAHPNIVTAFYAGQDKGMHYLAISYVNGETIESKLERNEIYDEKEALSVIRGIASALQYAWDEFKILHRDIKPANIILTDDNDIKLTDFGIARLKNSDLTMTRELLGSPAYMSPESFDNAKTKDIRSEIFSLGVIAYEKRMKKLIKNAK